MTPAITGLVYASSVDFGHLAASPTAHHFARFFVALGLGVALFLSAGPEATAPDVGSETVRLS